MAVKLHRCRAQFMKFQGHPCWRVEKALIDQGIEYERVSGPSLFRGKRRALIDGSGQNQYPAIQFEDGSWYREQSKDMEQTIRAGRLRERAPQAGPAEAGPAEAGEETTELH